MAANVNIVVTGLLVHHQSQKSKRSNCHSLVQPKQRELCFRTYAEVYFGDKEMVQKISVRKLKKQLPTNMMTL